MDTPRRFAVVEGSPAPDTAKARSRRRLRAHDKPAEMIACQRCSGREFVQTVTGALMRRGRPTGGTKTLICTSCLAQGERVAIL